MGFLRRYVVVILFICFVIAGLFVSKDYGVHMDESTNQWFGEYWSEYAMNALGLGHTALTPYEELRKPWQDHIRVHGPSFEMLLFATKNLILGRQADSREVVLFRHGAVFLTYVLAALCTYLLAKRMFRSRSFALVALAIFVLAPRVFADAFYNSVDIPFMAFFALATLTLVRYLERPTVGRAVVHGIALAILVDIRAAGMLLVVISAIAAFVRFVADGRRASSRFAPLRPLFAGAIVFAAVMLAFWPYLWEDPVGRFLGSMTESTFANDTSPLPASYNFVWIAATTPALYSFLVAVAVAAFAIGAAVRRGEFLRRHWVAGIALASLALSLVAPIITKSFLFDGWRHHYFVYPSFALLAAWGAWQLWRSADAIGKRFDYAKVAVRGGMAVALAASFAMTAWFMARVHPHEYVYASALSGADRQAAKVYLARDYWALSTRFALEYILAHDSRENISVASCGTNNAMILPKELRKRVTMTVTPESSDYVVICYRYPDQMKYASKPLVYSLEEDGDVFMSVHAMK